MALAIAIATVVGYEFVIATMHGMVVETAIAIDTTIAIANVFAVEREQDWE